MSNIQLGAAFDSSNIVSDKHTFNNIKETQHDKFLEEDHKLLADNGFTLFRESAWLSKSINKKGTFDWDWLDRLAKLSRGNIQLAISHYDYPPQQIFDFVYQLAHRYKGVFHSYIPFIELGTYCHMLTEYLQPKQADWWTAWKSLSWKNAIIAHILNNIDGGTPIAMSEPFNSFMSYDDQARPFNTLLGYTDDVAIANNCTTYHLGHANLLQMVGLNILHYDENKPPYLAILEASRRFPDQEIFIAETTNVWHQHIPQNMWLDYMMRNIDEARHKGANINTLFWCPAIQMYSHDKWELIGGSLFDINRKKLF